MSDARSLGVPSEPDLLSRITRTEQSDKALLAVLGELFRGHRQASPDPVQRVVLQPAMPCRVLLNPSSAFIEGGVGHHHDVEWIGDLDGVGEHRVEHRPVGR
jgi:hypothetical protein